MNTVQKMMGKVRSGRMKVGRCSAPSSLQHDL